MILTGWWNIAGWPTAEEWQAFWAFIAVIAAVVTALAAILAVWIARSQLGELIASNRELKAANDAAAAANKNAAAANEAAAAANKLAAEASLRSVRPFVSVDFEVRKHEHRNANGPLVASVWVRVTNSGRSPARDVCLSVEPAMAVEDQAIADRLAELFNGKPNLPLLNPGRSMAFMFAKAPEVFSTPIADTVFTISAKYSSLDSAYDFSEDFPLTLSVHGPALLETNGLRRISKDIQALTEMLRRRK